jgi:hypothetical protein
MSDFVSMQKKVVSDLEKDDRMLLWVKENRSFFEKRLGPLSDEALMEIAKLSYEKNPYLSMIEKEKK